MCSENCYEQNGKIQVRIDITGWSRYRLEAEIYALKTRGVDTSNLAIERGQDKIWMII